MTTRRPALNQTPAPGLGLASDLDPARSGRQTAFPLVRLVAPFSLAVGLSALLGGCGSDSEQAGASVRSAESSSGPAGGVDSGVVQAVARQFEAARRESSLPSALLDEQARKAVEQTLGLDKLAASGNATALFELPEGWVELPASGMRAASFRVGDDERTDCSLVLLAGDAGGLLANVNRWRQQIGAAPLDQAGVDELPRVEFLGGEGVTMDVAGSYAGMDGGAGEDGHRLIGVLQVTPAGSRFLKWTGPAEVLEAERDHFAQLARSMRLRPGGGRPRSGMVGSGMRRGADPHGGAPLGADPHRGVPGFGSAGSMGTAGSAGSVAAPPPGVAGGLSWQAPAGWREAPGSAFRVANYLVGEGSQVECYVTVLPGGAGGAEANINRWRNQMGALPLVAGELALAERVPMLSVSGVLMDVTGTYQGMGSDFRPASRMLGVVCVQPSRTVFVKMIGPAEQVAEQTESFRTFCRSLKLAGR